MLMGLFFATGQSPFPALNNVADSRCGPSWRDKQWLQENCSHYGSGYKSGYKNHPQNGAIVCPGAPRCVTITQDTKTHFNPSLLVDVGKTLKK